MDRMEIQTPEEIKASLLSDTLPPLEDVVYDIHYRQCFDLLPLFVEKYNIKDDSFNQGELLYSLAELNMINSEIFLWPSDDEMYQTPELREIEFSAPAQFETIKRIVEKFKRWKDNDAEEYALLDEAETMIAYLDEMCVYLKIPLISSWVGAMDPEGDLLDEAVKASVIESLGQFKNEYVDYLKFIGMSKKSSSDNDSENSPSDYDMINDENASANNVDDLNFE